MNKFLVFLTTLGILSNAAFGANKLGDVEIRNLTVTGSTTGVATSPGVSDWAQSTSYGLSTIVVDGDTNIQYRATSAHTSPGTGNLLDDAANWEIIGSASSGVILQGLADFHSCNHSIDTSYISRKLGYLH